MSDEDDILKKLEARNRAFEASLHIKIEDIPESVREDVALLREIHDAMQSGDYEASDFEESFIPDNLNRTRPWSAKQAQVIADIRERWENRDDDSDEEDHQDDDDYDGLQPWD